MKKKFIGNFHPGPFIKEAQLDVIIHLYHLFDSLKETIAKTNNTSFKSPEPQLPAARECIITMWAPQPLSMCSAVMMVSKEIIYYETFVFFSDIRHFPSPYCILVGEPIVTSSRPSIS